MTEGGGCANCDALALELANLEAELEEVRQQLEEVRQALEMIRGFCYEAAARAEAILSQPSGVPRGRWAFARGAHEIAIRVLALTQVC